MSYIDLMTTKFGTGVDLEEVYLLKGNAFHKFLEGTKNVSSLLMSSRNFIGKFNLPVNFAESCHQCFYHFSLFP